MTDTDTVSEHAQPEAHAEEPGPDFNRAADGGPAPIGAKTLGQTIDMLERGGFSVEAMRALSQLGHDLMALQEQTKRAQKGTFTVKLTLKTEGDAHFIEAAFTAKAPTPPRPRTMAWQDSEGRFLSSMPRQQIFFGADVGEHGPRQIEGVSRVIRTA